MKLFISMLAVFTAVFLFSACADINPSSSTLPQNAPSQKQVQTIAPFSLLHSAVDGSPKNGHAKNGMYYLQYLQDNSGDLQLVYLDYATAQAHVVCASPECSHNKETCTGWFSGSYGPGSVMAIDESVCILFSGSNPESKATVFPQIIKMDADGRNQKQLMKFSESSTFTGAFATDGTSIYVTEKAFERKQESYETQTKLLKIDLSTGMQSYLQIWDADVWIASAHENYLLLIKPENFDTNGFGIYEGANGAAYSVLAVDAQGNENQLHTVVEEGFLGTVRGDSFYSFDVVTNAIARTNLFTGEKTQLCTIPRPLEKGKIFWGEFLSNHLFISGALATRTSETDIKTLYSVDVEKGECTEINLVQEDLNLPDNDNPVCVVAQWNDQFLITNRMVLSQIAYVDNTGVKKIVEVMGMGYALITKPDLLASVPNYRNISPVG